MSDQASAASIDDSAPDAAHDFWTVHQGDARDLEELLQTASEMDGRTGEPFLQTTITSPPYATLVDYGPDNQIGFGQSHTDYLEACGAIFQSIHTWTLPTGSMWMVADSLMAPQGKNSPSRMIPLPFELAAKAEEAGWTLRDVIIWRKDRTRPWSHPGKLRNGFEYVLFFVKSNKFTFNVDKLRETGSLKSWWVKYPERHNPWGMTPDNVWEIPIPVQGSWDNSALRHACPFPPELVRRMVTLASDEGDVVFDPFAGSGTVVTTARHEGRRGLGIELNPDYVKAFDDVPVADARPERSEQKTVSAMTSRLLELRMLKYPKELAKQLLRAGFTSAQIKAVIMTVDSVNWEPARTGYGSITCTIVVTDEFSELEEAGLTKQVHEATAKAPLSKYGLQVKCDIVKTSAANTGKDGSTVAVYTKGRTWHAALKVPANGISAWIRESGTPTVIPIISALHVEQTLEESL